MNLPFSIPAARPVTSLGCDGAVIDTVQMGVDDGNDDGNGDCATIIAVINNAESMALCSVRRRVIEAEMGFLGRAHARNLGHAANLSY